jgi:hypothetical protein
LHTTKPLKTGTTTQLRDHCFKLILRVVRNDHCRSATLHRHLRQSVVPHSPCVGGAVPWSGSGRDVLAVAFDPQSSADHLDMSGLTIRRFAEMVVNMNCDRFDPLTSIPEYDHRCEQRQGIPPTTDADNLPALKVFSHRLMKKMNEGMTTRRQGKGGSRR